jgi:hypothetical protein
VDYRVGFIDDPFREDRHGRVRVFEDARRAGAYLGGYLGGGQLERMLAAADRGIAAVWVSPVLLARTGWTLARCRWVRQGYEIAGGRWQSRTWYGQLLLPSWWHDDDHRAWVCAVLGWDGLAGSLA